MPGRVVSSKVVVKLGKPPEMLTQKGALERLVRLLNDWPSVDIARCEYLGDRLQVERVGDMLWATRGAEKWCLNR